MKTTNMALFAAICMVISGGGVEAETYTWTGAANDGNKWSTPENWENNAAPSAATDVALFDIDEDATTDFNIDFSPIIQKRGTGKLTLSGNTYNNTASTGSVFLYGGSLDLGGGTATIYQPEDANNEEEPSWSGGTALYNGNFTYTSAHKVQADGKDSSSSIYWREGTLTLGRGATLAHAGQLFEYCKSAPAAKYGERRFFIDGGTLNMSSDTYHRYVIGVDNDWTKGMIFEVANGGKYYDKFANKTLIIGARNNGAGTSKAAKGVFIVRDGAEADIKGSIMLPNDSVVGTYARISLTNAVLTVGKNLSISDMGNSVGSDVAVEVNASTLSFATLTTQACPGTGKAAGMQTGIVILDNGGTLRALQNSSANAPFMKNKKSTANDTLCILSGGGAIDTQNYNVSLDVVAYGEGALIKKGTGTLTVTSANKFEGVLDAKEGNVVLTGSIAGGVAVSGGNFTTAKGGSYPLLKMDGGKATFSSAATFDKVEIGANGGTLELGTEGFAFNNVSGTDNLSAVSIVASPAGWSVGDPVLSSDTPAFLEWAAEELGKSLPDGFSMVAESGSLTIRSEVAAKTTTWTGNGADASWATAENWNEGAPNHGDTVILAGTAKTATTLDSELTLPLLVVDENAGAFSVSGEGSISVSKAVTNFSANAQTFIVPVEFGGAAENLHTVGDVHFNGGFSASSIAKTGAGTAFFKSDISGNVKLLSGGITMQNGAVIAAEGEGSVVIGGTLDLGGSSLSLAQAENADPNLLDGAVFKNGTVTYANAAKSGTLSLKTGTMTIGEGMAFTTAGMLFPVGSDAGVDFGARTLVIDGGTLNHANGNIAIAGVNSDWEKGAKVVIRNKGSLSATSSTIELGGYWSSATTTAASGELELDDGSMVVSYIRLGDTPNNNHRCIMKILNGSSVTATRTPQTNAGYCGFDTNERGNATTDAYVLLDHSTIETTRLKVRAQRYTGGKDIGRESTGIMQINGGTLKATFNDWANAGAWLVNDKDATYPAIELLEDGGIIDSNGKTVTASAVMYGEGGLTKKGSGTLTLSGDNLYEGGTVVEEGTLNVTGSVKGGVVVKSGGTFSCASDAVFESVTLEKGGKVAVPETYDGEWAEILRTTGEITVLDDMATNGLRLFVRRSNGQNVLCWGKRPGFMVILY